MPLLRRCGRGSQQSHQSNHCCKKASHFSDNTHSLPNIPATHLHKLTLLSLRLPFHLQPPPERDLRLSKRTEYGLRAIVQLAQLWPRNFVQSKDLAEHEDLPNKFLESI